MQHPKYVMLLALVMATVFSMPAMANDLFGSLVNGAIEAANSANQPDNQGNQNAQHQNAQKPNSAATAAAGIISDSVRTGTSPGDIIKYQARGSAEAMKYDARNSGANLINNLLTAPPQ